MNNSKSQLKNIKYQ